MLLGGKVYVKQVHEYTDPGKREIQERVGQCVCLVWGSKQHGARPKPESEPDRSALPKQRANGQAARAGTSATAASMGWSVLPGAACDSMADQRSSLAARGEQAQRGRTRGGRALRKEDKEFWIWGPET